MWASPNSDCFQPPKEWQPTGTGMGTLTPTMPASASSWNCRAAPPSRVKTAAPLPQGLASISSTASR